LFKKKTKKKTYFYVNVVVFINYVAPKEKTK